jgi:hypothetical protein
MVSLGSIGKNGWLKYAALGALVGGVAWWFITKPGGISGKYNIGQSFGVSPTKLNAGFDVGGEIDFPKPAYEATAYTSPTDRITMS